MRFELALSLCVRTFKCSMLGALSAKKLTRLQATASGDQTVGITDVTTQRAIGRLVGHTGTVKQVAWDPHNQCTPVR